MTIKTLVGRTPDDVLALVEKLRQLCQAEQVYSLAFVAITPDETQADWAGATGMELVGGLSYAAHILTEDLAHGG